METEAEFSRRELKNFLDELGEQVESGRVQIQIPGLTDGKVSTVPKQPITVAFNQKDDDDVINIEIKFEEKRVPGSQ